MKFKCAAIFVTAFLSGFAGCNGNSSGGPAVTPSSTPSDSPNAQSKAKTYDLGRLADLLVTEPGEQDQFNTVTFSGQHGTNTITAELAVTPQYAGYFFILLEESELSNCSGGSENVTYTLNHNGQTSVVGKSSASAVYLPANTEAVLQVSLNNDGLCDSGQINFAVAKDIPTPSQTGAPIPITTHMMPGKYICSDSAGKIIGPITVRTDGTADQVLLSDIKLISGNSVKYNLTLIVTVTDPRTVYHQAQCRRL